MANVFDYLEWRGELSFDEVGVCEVDNLIFSLLSYIDFDGIVPATDKKGSITIREAAKEYFFTHNDALERPLGLIIPPDILRLFRFMADTRRYRDLLLSRYVNVISVTREMQFSALTIRLPGEDIFVAFRGTDDTIVGWKEDFHLSYLDVTPSQKSAVAYLNTLDLTPETSLWVGGHSKGGNLAVWGVVNAEERIRRALRRVWSNDGPGFNEGMLNSEAYRSISDRVTLLVPEGSLVGLLLEHDGRYTVIKSQRRGLFQHDGITWLVLGSTMCRAEGLSKRGIRTDTVVRERIARMSVEERKKFTRIMFDLLESTGAKTLTDLYRTLPRAAVSVLRAYRELSVEDRDTATYLWNKLTGRAEEKPIEGEDDTAAGKKTDALQITSDIHQEKKRKNKDVKKKKHSTRPIVHIEFNKTSCIF